MDITFFLPSVVIEDGQADRPQVGAAGAWSLCFVEDTGDTGTSPLRPPGGVGTFEVTARPRATATPRPAGAPVPTTVHGPGFSAFWAAPRPTEGPVLLRGSLYCDLLYGGPRVAGTVVGIDLITETLRRGPGGPHDWQPVSTHRRPVAALPDRFDDGLVAGEQRHPGWYTLVRPDPWTSQTGADVHLDTGAGESP